MPTQIEIPRPPGEGLLRREPNRGVSVPIFSQEDVEDIFKLRGDVVAAARSVGS